MTSFITLMLIYTAAGTGIAVYAGRRRGKDQASYFIGGRGMSWLVSALTYAATTYSSFMMVGLVGLSYSTGIGAMIFEMTYLIATIILLSIYGKKIWQMSCEKELVSPMELFSLQFGKATGTAGALISAAALIPYTAAQVIGLSIIFQNFGISYATGVAIAAVLICVWSLIGGLRGVALTDAVQGLFMIAVAVVAVIWAGNKFGGIETSTFPNKVWTPVFFINITLPWAFFALTNPQVVQRLFIIKDKAGLKKMIILFAAVGTAYTVITCLLGFSAKYGTMNGGLSEITGRDNVILGLLETMGRGLGLATALSIVFASISTSNSIILTLSSMFTRDVVRKTDKIWYGRVFIVIITAFVAVFAARRTSYIVELSVSTSRILMCFLPLFFDLFHFKKGGRITGPLTIIGGAASAILFGRIGLQLSSVWTLAAAFGFYFTGVILDSRKLSRN
ncbi:MAG: sodium:solute symporter family protein [Spirochaetales bacterium]|uniref:Sodium:solute symporter family protein n=1 Tax=Candidatus Thalassospirochaeta sargassi TaxID=3119039 RepID=A0AAJ1MHM8_9SPIO|nr:sodium:solute symporter family protein [Spirochaetales bacterium]